MQNLSSRQLAQRRGSALLLVLAFLILLTALVIGFLTSSTLEDEFSNASLNQAKVDVVAQGAVASIIGDLQQEIVAGSNSTSATPSLPTMAGGYYYPNSPLTVVPAMVVPNYTPDGSTTIVGTGMEDLVKISYPAPFWPTANYNTPAPNRASSISSYTNPSLNNRSVTPARWNKPLLMKPVNVTGSNTTDFTPPSGFTPPDWIYVARDGSNPTTWSATYAYNANTPPTTSTTAGTTGCNAVTERYAYAIYDEGSTLDLNGAGSPSYSNSSVAYSALQPYKNALAYADLTQLPGLNSLNSSQQVALVNAIVGWRNGSTLANSSTAAFPNTYNFGTTSTLTTNPFDLDVLNNSSGFVSIGGSWLGVGTANPAPVTLVKGPNANQYKNQSDNAFASRQQLLQFMLQGLGENTTFTGSQVSLATLENLMPYLGTFSRDISQPSYAPPTNRPLVLPATAGGNNGAITPGATSVGSDNTVNPSFLNITATSTFTRNDGSTAVVGEPLVKKRFALNRLAWLTPQGPSASRTIPTTTPALGSQTYDMWQLVNVYGIPANFLAQGTAANIQAYFGLTWSNGQWTYGVHNGQGTGTGAICNLTQVQSLNRDPDFFELLKAGITVGSIGKALSNSSTGVVADIGGSQATQPYNYNYYAESSVDYQILQIGANIIAQFQPANLAPQIAFWDGNDPHASSSNPRVFVGVENLPYLSMISTGVIELSPPSPLPRLYVATATSTGTSTYSNVGTGIGRDALYATTPSDTGSFTQAGQGALVQVPVVWNPYDPSSPSGTQIPVQFRVLADSTTPNQVGSGAYTSFQVYAASMDPNPGGYNTEPATAPSNYSTGSITVATGTSTSALSSAHAYSGATGNEEIDLTVNSYAYTKELCPEPVALFRPKAITDSNGNGITVQAPSTALFASDGDLGSNKGTTGAGGGLQSYIANGAGMAGSLETQDPNGTRYIGFYLGAFPMAWKGTNTLTLYSAMQSGAFLTPSGSGTTFPLSATSSTNDADYMTYRMQYLDPNTNKWVTYDTKYGQASGSPGGSGFIGADIAFQTGSFTSPTTSPTNYAGSASLFGVGDWAMATDPRSSRFGLLWNSSITLGTPVCEGLALAQGPPGAEYGEWAGVSTYNAGWLDIPNGIMFPLRPDADSGFWCMTGWPTSGSSTEGGDGTYPNRERGSLGANSLANTGTGGSAAFATSGAAGPASGWMAYLASEGTTGQIGTDRGGSYPGIAPGLLSQNNTDILFAPRAYYSEGSGSGTQNPNYFADPDGIVRRGMAAHVPLGGHSPEASSTPVPPGTINASADTTVGLPMARAFKWASQIPTSPDPTITVYPGGPTAMTSQSQSRPYFLHRPFRSVAELGCVFSDTPWRNIDFFTAESGHTALLDIFTVNDTNDPSQLVAGRVNLNTRQSAVLQAVIAGGYLDPAILNFSPNSSLATAKMDSTLARSVAKALVARTTDTTNLANGTGPLQNVSELVGKYIKANPVLFNSSLTGYGSTASAGSPVTLSTMTPNTFYDGKLSYAGFSGGVWDTANHCPYPDLYSSGVLNTISGGGVENFSSSTQAPTATSFPEDVYAAYMSAAGTDTTIADGSAYAKHNGPQESLAYIQRFREAPIRALSAAGTTRVWNLMIDVIAQSGRFPSNTTNLANFNVEGERRYWVHVAIDRYTGRVLDEQIEEVKE